MNSRRHITAYLAMTISLAAICGPVEEARKLYRQGEYDKVISLLKPQVKKTPRDGNVTFFYGASLLKSGNTAEALAPLETAESRGVAEASQLLAQEAIDRYDTEKAQRHLDKWEATLKKGKKEIPQQLRDMASYTIHLRNMLDRVEKIEIIDSLTVDSADFFNHYRLSPAAGSLISPQLISGMLPLGTTVPSGPAFSPENRSEIIWGARDENGQTALYEADILDDGTLDSPSALCSKLAGGGNMMYPYLMPDGVTMYYASDGEGSLGGYDIFMTRRTSADDGTTDYFMGQNIGMPYNSTANDYMLAIDEASGLGWWATDRNAPENKVTVYIFAPSEMRVNIASDDPALTSYALITDISLTQDANTNYKALLQKRLPVAQEGDPKMHSAQFCIDLGNGRIYRSLKDFRNPQARSAMLDVLGMEAALRRHKAAEDTLRERYSHGDKSVSQAILESEAETESMRRRITAQRNNAINLENQ